MTSKSALTRYVPVVIALALILGTRCAGRMPGGGDEALPERGPEDASGGDPALLIRRSLDAYGERERIEGLKEIRFEDRITLFGEDGAPTEGHSIEYYRPPDRSRTDVGLETGDRTYLYDGVNGWVVKEGGRLRAADPITEGLRRGIKHIPIPLLRAALDERAILGPALPDDFQGRKALRVDLTDPEGDMSRLWFDPASLLLAGMEYSLITSRGSTPVRVVMSAYKPFDGVQTATAVDFYYRDRLTQQTRVDRAQYNPALPDSIFDPPAIEWTPPLPPDSLSAPSEPASDPPVPPARTRP